MSTYQQLAGRRILHDLQFSDNQLDLIGKMLSLDSKVVTNVVIDYTTLYFRGPILEVNKQRELNIEATLHPSLDTLDHDSLMYRIKNALEDEKIPTRDLFSYCSKSYGLEAEGVSIHFGIDRSGK